MQQRRGTPPHLSCMTYRTLLLSGLFLGVAAVAAPQTGRAQSEGRRYDTCYSLDEHGRPIRIMNQPTNCNMLEFQRQECEQLRRSKSASEMPVLNLGHCFGFEMEHVRGRPSAGGASATGSGR